MPNEVINTILQLAAACNKYKGILFTEKEGNVIYDQNYVIEDNVAITGVNENKETYDHSPKDYSPTILQPHKKKPTAHRKAYNKTPSSQK